MLTNPYTGRLIKNGGKVHHRLQKGGVLTPEEADFIAQHNIKGKFRRAISQLPANQRPSYEMHLENPALAQHLRDAESDVAINRRHRAAMGYDLDHYDDQDGGFSFGSSNKDLDNLSQADLKSIIASADKDQNAFFGLLSSLPPNSKYAKRLNKVLNEAAELVNEIRNDAARKL